ncbi:MarR family transcriptional regulator [Microbacterium sp. Root53]|uniref:MarR family winged helix-turn-helix transcriptional regulator n=1 Tax=Microbacterium sp. Root53 TaxID=1736553 RepID=UPI0006F4CB01|nr:MarR family transcriptional regulator [Microbacterium sp. Root53]KQY97628.1 MarR family transcriptional regulator [Microbacterium sp. Root53]
MTSDGGRADAPVTEQPLASDAAFLLARANARSLAVAHAALAEFDLRVRSYSVLALAVAEARLSQRHIAEYLRLDPSQVVALVDELQQRGAVAREPDPNDRRAKVVVATAAGRALHAKAERATNAAEREVLGVLDQDDQDRLRDLLYRLAFPD